MRRLMFLLLLTTQVLWAATVWRWRDADGVVHYSDQPVTGAEQVSTSPSNTFATPPAAVSGRSSASSSAQTVTSYRIAITQPQSDETLSNTGGSVAVSLRIEPQLAEQHQVLLFLDGQQVSGFPPRASSYQLANVERGQHSVMAVVQDARGTRLASSASVTFYVQQPSILRKP